MNSIRTFAQINNLGNIVIENLPFNKGEVVEIFIISDNKDKVNLSEQWKFLFNSIRKNINSELISEEDIRNEINDYRNEL